MFLRCSIKATFHFVSFWLLYVLSGLMLALYLYVMAGHGWRKIQTMCRCIQNIVQCSLPIIDDHMACYTFKSVKKSITIDQCCTIKFYSFVCNFECYIKAHSYRKKWTTVQSGKLIFRSYGVVFEMLRYILRCDKCNGIILFFFSFFHQAYSFMCISFIF